MQEKLFKVVGFSSKWFGFKLITPRTLHNIYKKRQLLSNKNNFLFSLNENHICYGEITFFSHAELLSFSRRCFFPPTLKLPPNSFFIYFALYRETFFAAKLGVVSLFTFLFLCSLIIVAFIFICTFMFMFLRYIWKRSFMFPHSLVTSFCILNFYHLPEFCGIKHT